MVCGAQVGVFVLRTSSSLLLAGSMPFRVLKQSDCEFLRFTGEQPKSGIVASITGSKPPLVTGVEDERMEFDDGDYVTFTEVKGIPALNDGQPRRVKNCRGNSFEIDDDLSGQGEHQGGGQVTEVGYETLPPFV